MVAFKKNILVLTILFGSSHCAYCDSLDIDGQLSGWFTSTEDESQVGIRYLPELSWIEPLSATYELSAEVAVNARWFSNYDQWDYTDDTLSIDPYRIWMRFASPQYELRGGLQKINFGSASLLRPLMWFDTLDPRDPLQLTEGVYGLLGRYYFLNNTNIWLWMLTGNEDLKGWETLPTDKWSVEFGGRIQIAALTGELGISYDRRSVDNTDVPTVSVESLNDTFDEDRFGFDAKWDIGVGVWFEGTLTHQDMETIDLNYQRLSTIGVDYTFDLGNGLHVLGEHLESVAASGVFGSGQRYGISALSADYPVGILDTVMTIVYYNWEEDYWSSFVSWQRSYDNWQINVNFFSNPDETLLDQENSTTNSFAGQGIQLLLVFNH